MLLAAVCSLTSVSGSPRLSNWIGCSEVWITGVLLVVTGILVSLSLSVCRRRTKPGLNSTSKDGGPSCVRMRSVHTSCYQCNFELSLSDLLLQHHPSCGDLILANAVECVIVFPKIAEIALLECLNGGYFCKLA